MSLAAIRPDSVNFPLFLHVLGAMVLTGGLIIATLALVLAWRRMNGGGAVVLARLGLRSFLLVVIPGYVLMRIAAQWTEAEEFPDQYEADWLDVGYLTADVGALVILLTIVPAVLGLRRLRREGGERSVLPRIVAVASTLLLAAYLVAVWAMTTKPS